MNLMAQSRASNLEIIVGRNDGSVHFHRLPAVDRFGSRSTAGILILLVYTVWAWEA
jgi:hypothetical protein